MPQPPFHLPATRMSADDYVALNLRLWRAQPDMSRLRWALGLGVLILALSIGLDLLRYGRPGYISLFIFLGVALGGTLSHPAFVRSRLRRGFRQGPTPAPSITYFLTDTEITQQSQLGEFSVPWPRIRRAVWVGSDWLLLHPSETACYYLDLRQLLPPATPTDLADLLVQHAVPQQRV